MIVVLCTDCTMLPTSSSAVHSVACSVCSFKLILFRGRCTLRIRCSELLELLSYHFLRKQLIYHVEKAHQFGFVPWKHL